MSSDREDIKFFKVTKKTGRETHHFQVGLYRFDRRKVGKNGLGYFSCSNRDCRATLSALYVQIYEDCLNEFVSGFREQEDEKLLENFTRGMPTEVQFVRTMYRLSYFRYQSL